MAENIKSVEGVAIASIKSIQGVIEANLKSMAGVDNTAAASGITVVGSNYSEQTSNVTSHQLDVGALDIQVDDLICAYLSIDPSSGTMTDPSGWTNEVSTEVSVRQHFSWKVAVSADTTATDYTWTTGNVQQSVGGLVVLRGIDTSEPIETTAGQVRSGSGTSAAPESRALNATPKSDSYILRGFSMDGGRVTPGTGYPTGMDDEFWIDESGTGPSGPACGGLAGQTGGSGAVAVWTADASDTWVGFSAEVNAAP